ncbi:MAG: hypothetical protein ACE5H9_09195 [Anaerolineae bacterium]
MFFIATSFIASSYLWANYCTAWVDEDGDGIQDPDEPFNIATITWEKPTAITLISFTATGQNDQVLIE